jgi:DNA end-binding protein Ku
MITPDELAAADPRRTKTIDIEDFVELADIDPIYYARTYYLEPGSGDGAKHAYVLLRDAMDKTGRAAIGRFVFRTKQYLIVLRPLEDCLTITTLSFSDEVRDWRKLDIPRRVKTDARELRIATQLIDSLTTDWKPEKYDDTYRERVLKLIRDKAKGKEITVEEAEEPAPVTDLLEALKASLDRRPKRSTRARKPAARTRKSA